MIDIIPWVIMVIGLAVLILLPGRRNVFHDPAIFDRVPRQRKPPPPASLLPTIVSAGVSITVLLCALYVILSAHYGEAAEKWAFGIVGTILGINIRELR